MNENYYVIIMAGGIGSRFWPMSRTNFPKQFHDILGTGKTLIQDTFNRFSEFIPKQNIFIVTNGTYKELVKEQLKNKVKDDQILCEPFGKNTAPCVAYASYKIHQKDPNAILIVAASDHLILDKKRFRKQVESGMNACAENEIIMTLGIKPTHPNTGYGYIQFGPKEKTENYHKVKLFTEKPSLELAIEFIESGDFVWNSGIFLFSSRTIINAFQQHLSEMAESFAGIPYFSEKEQVAVDNAYKVCQNISIDYGIMEKAQNVFVTPIDCGWSDLGTWGSVYENSEKDYFGNALKGNIMVYNSNNNVIHGLDKDKLIVIKGLEDYIVVDTKDVLLICKKEEEQFIKNIVADIKSKNATQFT